MRAEIQRLQRALGVTTIYVTHDQIEAMTMGDRIAVMRDGALQQVDTPERVYTQPANQFVAGFIGSPAMNMVEARLTRTNDGLAVVFGGHEIAFDSRARSCGRMKASRSSSASGPRISRTRRSRRGIAGPVLATVCALREALGSEVLLHFSVSPEAATFVARVHPQTAAREGEPLLLAVDTTHLHFFDPETGARSSRAPRSARSLRLSALDPLLEKVDLRFRPCAVARHAAVCHGGEDGFGVAADVVVGPQVELRLHRVAVALAEHRLDVRLEAELVGARGGHRSPFRRTETA